MTGLPPNLVPGWYTELVDRGVNPAAAYDTIVQEVCRVAPELVEEVETVLKAVIGEKRPIRQRGRFLRVRKATPCP